MYYSIKNSIKHQRILTLKEPVSFKVTNVTNRYMDFILDHDKELIFKDLYVLTPSGSTIINQKFVDSMFALGAVAIQM